MPNPSLSYMWQATNASKGKLPLLRKVFPKMPVNVLAELTSCYHWSQRKIVQQVTEDMSPDEILETFRRCTGYSRSVN